jgi:signal transduction histidine kinase
MGRREVAASLKRERCQNERNRMARELHDTLAQGFTGVHVQLQAAEAAIEGGDDASRHLSRAIALAEAGLSEARRSLWMLRPRVLEQKGFAAALRDSAHALVDGSGVTLELDLPDSPPMQLGEHDADWLRIATEAITNALKHARASHLRISCAQHGQGVRLIIEDDGVGFDTAAPALGLGLTAMRERAERIGARLTVASTAGGTRVLVENNG